MKILKLYNQIKHYEWGSVNLIPDFIGVENKDKRPCAEMWMGTHSLSPSHVQSGGKMISLAQAAGRELPFLFKLLAVEKPLSIQAHPNKAQAREGFLRENMAGIPIDAYERNYKDTNHKPEIICAITPFTMMAGFREAENIRLSLKAFMSAAPQLKEIIAVLLRAFDSGSIAVFFNALFNLSKSEKEYASDFIIENKIRETEDLSSEQLQLMKKFALQYHADAAILSPLYLNVITIQRGQAVFIPAGILHAYIYGFGVELMSSSDNVLRGGLTPKHIDIEELMKVLKFSAFIPQVLSPDSDFFRYPSPCDDFSLILLRGGKNTLPTNSGAICIVTEGELNAADETFKKGESFYVCGGEDIVFSGNYSLFVASTAQEAGAVGAQTT
ncbi:MAG: mannose-6-phosphate isomerase, class I [Treponema sp.]|jgi:mannose-6-phosphate isomerase|nr:mannose-6-phosphate isomerase, class I [Treponema sp.]